MTTTTSPSATSRSTSASATVSPNRLPSPRTRSTGVLIGVDSVATGEPPFQPGLPCGEDGHEDDVPDDRDDQQRHDLEGAGVDVAGGASRSVIEMTLTREVPLSSEITWLPMGGRMIRVAWGSRMRKKVSRAGSPSELAASSCPRGTADRPERMISAL